jgi:hypothetical protein
VTRRLRRRLADLRPRAPRTALLAALVLATLAPGAPAGAQAAGGTPADVAATLEEIATCVSGSGRLLVVLLIDESGSLRQTDPGNERVTAAKLALQSFASLASSDAVETPPQIDVIVAGFSSTFGAATGFVRLDDRSVASLSAAVDTFASRNTGIDTDFPTALLGAQRALADRSAELSASGDRRPCKVVLMFTDGKYDVETGDTPARRAAGTEKEYAPGRSLLVPANREPVLAAGRAYLCNANGLADRLRDDGAAIVTVALSAQIDPADQIFLRALSTGEASGISCGRTHGPEAGAYVSTADLGELTRLFNDIVNRIGGGGEDEGDTERQPCNGPSCVLATRRIQVEPMLSRVTIVANNDEAGVHTELHAPGVDEPLVLTPGDDGQQELAGAQVRWSWVSPTTVNVDLDLIPDTDDWVGEWTVTFVADNQAAVDASPDVEVFQVGAWKPEVPGDVEFVRGEEIGLRVAIRDGADRVVDPRAVEGARVRLSGTVDDGSASKTVLVFTGPNAQNEYEAVYVAPRDLERAAVDVDVKLVVRTPSGDLLAPAAQRIEVPVKAPDVFPTLAPATLELSSVRGTGTAKGTIVVTGGSDRASCVWFGETNLASYPPEAGAFNVSLTPGATSRDTCVELDPGQAAGFELGIAPQSAAEGRAEGAIVAFFSVADEDVVRVTVPISFDMAPPISEARRLGIFFAILLPGVLAPVGALLLVNQVLARFEPSTHVQVARVPVTVERSFGRIMRVYATDSESVAAAGAPVRRLGPDGPEDGPVVRVDDFAPFQEGRERSRVLRWRELRFRAEAPRSPFGVPSGRVTGPEPVATGGVTTPVSREARLPLALPGTWVFVLDRPSRGEAPREGIGAVATTVDTTWITGELVVFLADAPAADQLVEMLAAINDQLPAVANDVADRASERALV